MKLKKNISILFITMGVNEGASRFRVQQYLPYLELEEYRYLNFPLHWGKKHPENYGLLKHFCFLEIMILKFVSIFFAPFFDVVFLQRGVIRNLSPFPEKLIKRLNENIIFDFDDAIWLTYNQLKINPVPEVIKISRKVIVGNKFLFDYAVQLNKDVTIIPTPVEVKILKPIFRSIDDHHFKIGWSGVYQNYHYLYQLVPVFKKLSAKYGDRIRLVILSNRKPKEPFGIQYQYLEWSAQNESKIIPTFDIGIMPLKDDEWSRGKCAFKVLQYMAAGVPVIASPIGMNKEVIDIYTGFLAKNYQEWYDILCQLIDDQELRAKNINHARQKVISKYSVEASYPLFKQVIDSCLIRI